MLHYKKLLFILKIIETKLISWHYNNLLVSYFGINKTKKLVSQKYYWLSLQKDIEAYVKGCDICLGLKAVKHKLYKDSQSLSIPTHYYKNLCIDFITGIPILANWKIESYNSILVIVDMLKKNDILGASQSQH